MNENSGTYIIVTWNNEKEIEDCLSTVSRYSPKNSKVIVVDNNSNDRTVQIIKEKFPETELIERKTLDLQQRIILLWKMFQANTFAI